MRSIVRSFRLAPLFRHAIVALPCSALACGASASAPPSVPPEPIVASVPVAAPPTDARANEPSPPALARPASEDATAAVAPVAGSDALPASDASLRADAIALLDAGKIVESLRILSDLLERHPTNASVIALYDGASNLLRHVQQDAAASFVNARPTRLSRPPFQYTLVENATLTDVAAKPMLIKLKESRNQITDDEDWVVKNGLAMPGLRRSPPSPSEPRGGLEMPQGVPSRFGRMSVAGGADFGDHVIIRYGFMGEASVVATFDAKHQLQSLLDLQDWSRPRAVTAVFGGAASSEAAYVHEAVGWAQMKDGVLFVQNGHRTYAKASNGENAYVSALDAKTGRLLWRSAPLVSNSSNFILRKGFIFTGYGFTAEPDFLYVLDAQNGRTVQKIPVNSGPEILVEKDGKLYVRCYDTDYVFDIR